MAEGGIRLEEIPSEEVLNKTNPFEEINTLQDIKAILNDSSYVTVREKTNTEELKNQMTNENFHKLEILIEEKFRNMDKNQIALSKIDLRKRILSKGGDLYLRTTGSNVKEIQFGKHKYKAIKITKNRGKDLIALSTLKSNGMSITDPYYQLLNGEIKTQETSFIKDDQGNIIGNIEDKQIENTETLRKTIAFAHDDMIIRPTSTPKQKSIIEDIPRHLEESKELNNVLTAEDRQLIVKHLDFLQLNKTKTIQLLSDIEHNKKLINKAEKQLLTETDEDQKDALKKVISDSEANIQSSKQMLDQILTYNERQYEDINMRLKSKFTLREKLSHIFRKYGLTITAITLALGLVIDTIITSVRGTPNLSPTPSGNNFPDKVKQSLKNFANWLLDMSKKALDNLPAIIGSIISFLLKTTASIIGFLAEHLILFVIALAFALYEAIMIGYNDIKQRK